MFLRGNGHLFWSRTRDDGAGFREGGSAHVVDGTAKWVRDLVYGRFCLHVATEEGFLQLQLDNVGKGMSSLKDKSGKFHDQCHRRRAIRAREQRRKPSPKCADLLEHIWQFSKTKSRLLK